MTIVPAPHAALRLLEDKPLKRLLDLLSEEGGEARIVGGAIRNALLGVHVHEVDVTTTLLPDEVMARAGRAGIRAIPTGITHGTVTLLIDGESFEVTTLREDVETDGRHAVVRFGGDFMLDAQRRDFTVNALSMGRDGRIHDETNGLADIEARRIRFIGDAQTRIREDYLRILRFFRFSAFYTQGPLDAEGLAASSALRDGLGFLSRERVRVELLKLLVAPRAAEVVGLMSELGLIGPLLTLAPDVCRLQRLIAFQPQADAILRLAALCVLTPEDADRLRDSLRLSNDEHKRLAAAAEVALALHAAPAPLPEHDLRKLLFEAGRQAGLDGVTLRQACVGPQDASLWQQALGFLAQAPDMQMPFSGTDLQKRGFAQGRALGLALKDLQARWIRAGFPQEPHRLAQLLDEVVAEQRS